MTTNPNVRQKGCAKDLGQNLEAHGDEIACKVRRLKEQKTNVKQTNMYIVDNFPDS